MGDSLTATDDFSVIPTEYDNNGKELSLFILSTQWQYRAGWEPLIKGEFKATQNGKSITIPLSVHKSQRNVFTVEKKSEPINKKLALKDACRTAETQRDGSYMPEQRIGIQI